MARAFAHCAGAVSSRRMVYRCVEEASGMAAKAWPCRLIRRVGSGRGRAPNLTRSAKPNLLLRIARLHWQPAALHRAVPGEVLGSGADRLCSDGTWDACQCKSGDSALEKWLSVGLVALCLGGCSVAPEAQVVNVQEEAAGVGAQPAPLARASRVGGQRGQGMPYEIVGSEVWNVPDPVSKRDYQVFVSVPRSYSEAPGRRYPVLYVTDADYAFPVVRSIARRLNVERPQIDEFILVGLSYALGEEGMPSRRRDYTPTPRGPSSAPAGAVHGKADAYITYLRDEVIGFVASRYRTDEARRMLLGHSYGSLLGAQILFTEPEMFSGYVLGSPSFWYDGNVMEKFEQQYARRKQDLDASVYMYVGEYEERRFGKRDDMVPDARRMEKSMQSRNYPSLRVRLDVLNGEDHESVAPRGFTYGLKYLLGTGNAGR